jgi:hypothetical protein
LSGNIFLNGSLQSDLFVLKSEGNNRMTFDGKVKRQKIELTGKGLYDAENLTGRECDIRIVGNYEATVRPEEELSVYIVGNSTLYYLGSPNVLEKRMLGGSKLIPKRGS